MNLLRHGDVDAAERELAAFLVAEPADAPSRSLRALCLAELGRLDEAEAEARRAVETEPYLGYCHWALGTVLADRRRWTQAALAARHALVREPESGDAHCLLARALAGQERWAEALEAADAGLEAEVDHPGCANFRAAALHELGRPAEAEQAWVDAAAAEPDTAFARAASGWTALRRGAPGGEALPYFQNALSIDPRNEWARDGLLAALKARNPLYRGMLRFFVWMDALTPRTRWMVMVGGVVGYNFLRRSVEATPSLAPVAYPLMAAYALFVLLTWVTEPVFDFLLRFDPVGRTRVPPERALAGSAVVTTLAVAVTAAAAAAVTGSGPLFLLALLAGVLVVPLSGTFSAPEGWPRRTMAVYTAAVAATGALGLAFAAEGLVFLAVLGAVLGSWIAAGLRELAPAR